MRMCGTIRTGRSRTVRPGRSAGCGAAHGDGSYFRAVTVRLFEYNRTMTALEPTREQLRLSAVLEALANPLRLQVVVRLSQEPAVAGCGELMPELSRSTASHHLRMLRDSGVMRLIRDGRYLRPSLRRDDLDARFPGLLDVILANAGEQRAATT
jgi:DNA-binding transcriptional ArsR family regulator